MEASTKKSTNPYSKFKLEPVNLSDLDANKSNPIVSKPPTTPPPPSSFPSSSSKLKTNTDNNKKVDKVESDLLNFVFHQIIDSNFIDNFLNSNDTSEETFYYSIKLINNVMANRSYRTKFLKYELIMKILGYFDTRKRETKKENRERRTEIRWFLESDEIN